MAAVRKTCCNYNRDVAEHKRAGHMGTSISFKKDIVAFFLIIFLIRNCESHTMDVF